MVFSVSLYTYDEDGTDRCENITDWALEAFQTYYDDENISKWDIFYYNYGLLHHPDYRRKYQEDLKQSLPRILVASYEPLFDARMLSYHTIRSICDVSEGRQS